MNDELLLESLDRHFMAGCLSLSAGELRAHELTGSCHYCRERAAAISVPAAAVVPPAAGDPR